MVTPLLSSPRLPLVVDGNSSSSHGFEPSAVVSLSSPSSDGTSREPPSPASEGSCPAEVVGVGGSILIAAAT